MVICRIQTGMSMLVVVLFVVALSVSGAPAPNLVSNGEFGLDVDGNGVPDDWQVSGGKGVLQELSLDVGRDGGRSARIHCSEFAPDGGAPHVMLCQMGKVAVQRGKTYRLTFWARQRGLRSPVVSIALRDTNGWHDCGLSGMFSLVADLGEEWQSFSFLFSATRDCSETSRLQFWHAQVGTLWIDDVTLVKMDGMVYRPGNLVTTEAESNLVPNSSFECGGDQWGSVSPTRLPWGGIDELVGTIDQKQAYHGKSSLRISLSPETFPVYDFDYFDITHAVVKAPLAGSRGWVALQRGRPHTLSVYVKAGDDGTPVRLGLCEFPSGRFRTELVSARSSWERRTVTITPNSHYGYVVVGPDLREGGTDSCVLWVDAVQLEEGTVAGDYVSGRPVELGVDTGRVGNVFTQGDSVTLNAHVANVGLTPVDLQIAVILTDFRDVEVVRKSLSRRVEAGDTLHESIDVDPGRLGFFRLQATLVTGETTLERTLRMAVIPGFSASDSFLGVNHAHGRPHILKLCRVAGLTWFRDWSLKWRDVEPEPGRWDFSRTDREIDRILAEDVNVLAMLPFPSNERNTTAPVDLAADNSYMKQRLRVAFAPREKAEFRAYVRETIAHYKGRVSTWQIFNEPLTTSYSLPREHGYESKDYAYWLHEAWDVAKATDPGCRVLIGFAGLGPRIIKEFEGIFAEGALAWCDAVTVHSYPRVTPPEENEKHLQAILGLMDRHGGKKPILMTEHGYYCDDDPEVLPRKDSKHLVPLPNEALHAAYAMRSVIVQLANGVERVFFHSGRCTRLNQDNAEGIFLEYGGAPRQIYAAAAGLTHILPAGAVFRRKLELGDGVWAYLFRDGSTHVLAAWNRSGKDTQVLLGSNALNGHDMMGNRLDQRTIALTWSPLYVVAAGVDEGTFLDAVSVSSEQR